MSLAEDAFNRSGLTDIKHGKDNRMFLPPTTKAGVTAAAECSGLLTAPKTIVVLVTSLSHANLRHGQQQSTLSVPDGTMAGQGEVDGMSIGIDG